MNTDFLKGKRIIIFQQRNWGKLIGRYLAKKLYAEGCILAALTFKKTVHELILNQPDIKYEMIINNDEVMEDPKKYLNGEKISLEKICEDLNIDSIWPIVYTMRNHVKSYKDKYYYGFKQNVPDEEIIDFVTAVYKYIRTFFNEFKPDVIISPNFVSLPHIMFNLYAKNRGIKIFALTDCKVSGKYIFSENYFDDKGLFYERIDELNSGNAKSENAEKAKKYISEFRDKFKNPSYVKTETEKTLWQKIRHELLPFYQIWMWYTRPQKDFLKTTGITIDYRPPRIILRDFYCNKKYKRWARNFKYHPFEKIEKFVYFPLQFQPEATIDVVAPFASNQIETARQVAMSLPNDYTLVVKEHPAMIGLRPPSYLEKIARTVNIKLIDYRIRNEEVMKKADLIISPGSTTLAEAAFLKKPAIQLGNLGTTLKLPNVFKHTDMTTLSLKIKEVLKIKLGDKEYEKRLENFVASAYDTSLSTDYLKIWDEGKVELLPNLWKDYLKQLKRVFNVK